MKNNHDNFLSYSFLKSEFVKNSTILFIGTTTAQLLSVLLYPVFSRMYTPEQFGTFALFTSITGIVALLSSGVFELAILLPKQDHKALALLLLVVLLTLSQCLVFLIVILCFKHYLADRVLNNILIEPYLLLIPVSVILNNIFAAFTYYANRNKYYALISQSSINQGLGMNLAKLIFGLFHYTGGGLILGKIIGQLTSSIQLVIQIIRKNTFNIRKIKNAFGDIKEVTVLYKNFPLFRLPHSLMNTFSTALPVFMLNKYFSSHDAGQYSLAAGILLTPVVLLVGSASKVINQKIIERINSNLPVYNQIFKFLLISMPIVASFFIIFYFFSEPVFILLFGHEWQQAGKIAGILLPWVFMVLFTSPFSFIPDIFFKQRKAMLIDAFYLILRITAMAAGIYLHSVMLAILLFVITGCIVLIYCFLWYLSFLKTHDKRLNDAEHVSSA